MKAFIAYDKRGRITAVAIPNPELGDNIGMEATDGDSILEIDASEIVKNAGRASGESEDRLQMTVRTIVEQYRVDPASRRLVPQAASK